MGQGQKSALKNLEELITQHMNYLVTFLNRVYTNENNSRMYPCHVRTFNSLFNEDCQQPMTTSSFPQCNVSSIRMLKTFKKSTLKTVEKIDNTKQMLKYVVEKSPSLNSHITSVKIYNHH